MERLIEKKWKKEIEMLKCHTCATSLPATAKFCFNCGEKVVVKASIETMEPVLDVKGDIEKQFNDLFFSGLKKALEREQDVTKLQQYSERVYESGFRDFLQRRAAQLAEKVNSPDFNRVTLNELTTGWLSQLLDIFIIRDCADLNVVAMPEAILKYQQADKKTIDIFAFIMDYMHFDIEKEIVYTDFLRMPVDKLKNAGKSFLFPEKTERIFFLCDLSLLGSCKEGFAMTEKAIYWKVQFQKPKKVRFSTLNDLHRIEDWVTINGHFFNANTGLNVRLLKLLGELKRFF